MDCRITPGNEEPSIWRPKVRTILITGFASFPGARLNPTEALVAELARARNPASLRRVGHVFRVSYEEVDRELPDLVEAQKPDALIMFGLAARTRHLRIETTARNALARMLPDVDRRYPGSSTIVDGAPAELPLATPALRLLRAAQWAGVPCMLSRDAGTYLCNYLCWQASRAARMGAPRLTAFVHVPSVGRPQSSCTRQFRITHDDLLRAGEAMIRAMVPLMR
jgi:pyroglutamyl-peptidase